MRAIGTICVCIFIMRHIILTLRLCLLILSLSSMVLLCGGCGGGSVTSQTKSPIDPVTLIDEAMKPGEWTILVYMDADNDLESYAIDNLNQMEKIGSSKGVRIVVQVDRNPGYDKSNGDWSDTRRYFITKDTNLTDINSYRMDAPQPLGELDMADSRNLKSFVEWGANTFPAQHYCVILWNHGTGWEFATRISPAFTPSYVLSDDTSGNSMNITEIAYAVSILKPDILAFDACYMQQVEIAYQLRDSARYMLGSTGAIPSSGFNYSGFLAQTNSGSTPQQVGKSIVDSFVSANRSDSGIQMSMVDLSRMADVAAATNAFSNTLLANRAGWSSYIEQAREQSLDYSISGGSKERYLIDLAGYAERCNEIVGASLLPVTTRLRQSVKTAVVAEGHGSDSTGATGLSVYFPKPGSYDSAYQRLDFAKSTSWDTLVSGSGN